MARTSRKAAAQTIVPNSVATTYSTALYIRLSIMDSGKKDGESIINQQEMLEQYIASRPELALREIFVDNGETGVDFHRPAWTDLMNKCHAGKINCIVLKDLSRLGRNYIETGDYLERIFPMLGVRLIAVTDGYDSLSLTNGERLVSSLKNLVNDIYAKDISRKVCAAMLTKQKNGEFIGGAACYGYLKDEGNKNKLVLNPETAPIVRQIFEWKAEGLGNTVISQRLESLGTPSPNKYKYLKGILHKPKFADSVWIPETIARLLRNTAYLGHMSQGKMKEALYAGQPKREMKRENWIIVENTHEPIVSQELFDAANAVLNTRKAHYDANYGKHNHLDKTTSILQGQVFCAECGRALKRRSNVNRKTNQVSWSYECRMFKTHKTCAKKSISESDLYAAVYEAIRVQLDICVDVSGAIDKLNRESSYKSRLARHDAQIEEIEKELRRITTLKRAVYEDYVAKLLTASEYQFANNKYNADIAEQSERLEIAKNTREEFSANTTTKNRWFATYSRFADCKELTADMAKVLVERIDVHEGHKIEVVFKFRDEYSGGEVLA